ncbi:MAG: cation diffusion facilitator family transporter [Sphingomonadaceae bacterium]
MNNQPATRRAEYRLLIRFMYLSVAAAIATIILKGLAAYLTGSVGFLSDALESVINLAAAAIAIIALNIASRPPDAEHNFGHGRAEYFSALIEGVLIFVAATAIIYSAVQRLFEPQPLQELGIGLLLTTVASLLNLAVGVFLIRKGQAHRSATLTADGHHLLTDVWTSVGVLVGIAAVWLTGWLWLDAVIALLVGANILFTGYRLLRASASGLLGTSLPDGDLKLLDKALDRFRTGNPVSFQPTRTAFFGRARYAFVVMEVPAEWSVGQAHRLTEELEAEVHEILPGTETFIHVEPSFGSGSGQA